MTDNTEQIRALIADGEKATQGDWFISDDNSSYKEVYVKTNDGEFSVADSVWSDGDDVFITQAANSRQAIAEMLEDNERMREALEEIVNKSHEDYQTCASIAKQALKGTDDE